MVPLMSSLQSSKAFLKMVEIGSDWPRITSPGIALLLEPRDVAGLAAEAGALTTGRPFSLVGHGDPGEATAMLGNLPPALAKDIAQLAKRLAQVTNAARLRIRLECVTGNSCRKVHVDRTDLRLITTYAGLGTQVPTGSVSGADEDFYDVPTGWIGLYKGSLYGDGRAPCRHRSAPAGDLGVKRLVLVIDTPGFAAGQWQELQVA